jgi:NADH dehydrogenase
MADIDVVTGAFGYTGRYLSTRLLAAGHQVRTLTHHPRPDHPLAGRVEVHPLAFDDHDALVGSLRGAGTLYNTYWVRYVQGGTTYEQAVANTRALIAAAVEAGVERLVHVSITNPDPDSFYPYYRGKAELEQVVRASGLSYAIVRPTVLFGEDDIFVNDIAWLVRHFPVFTVPGDGRYQLRPVATADLADLMVDLGRQRADVTVDAVGPQRFAFEDLVALIARAVGARCRLLHTPPAAVVPVLRVLDRITGDVVLTRDEIRGLMAGYVDTDGPTTCPTRLTDHLAEHAEQIGARYQSELARRR